MGLRAQLYAFVRALGAEDSPYKQASMAFRHRFMMSVPRRGEPNDNILSIVPIAESKASKQLDRILEDGGLTEKVEDVWALPKDTEGAEQDAERFEAKSPPTPRSRHLPTIPPPEIQAIIEGNRREVESYTPPAYDSGESNLPVQENHGKVCRTCEWALEASTLCSLTGRPTEPDSTCDNWLELDFGKE